MAEALSRSPHGPPLERGIGKGKSQEAKIEAPEGQLTDLLQLPPLLLKEGGETIGEELLKDLEQGVLPNDSWLASKVIAQSTQFEVVNSPPCFIDLI